MIREVLPPRCAPCSAAHVSVIAFAVVTATLLVLCAGIEWLHRANIAAEQRRRTQTTPTQLEAAHLALDALDHIGIHGYAEVLPGGAWHIVVVMPEQDRSGAAP